MPLLDGSDYFINADDEKVIICGTCDEVEPTDENYAVSHCCYKKGLRAEIERLTKQIEEEFCYEHEQKKWGYHNGELLKCSGCLEEELPSPPIREDAFKYNSKCVCEKKEDNDYPCLCDDLGPTDDEEEQGVSVIHPDGRYKTEEEILEELNSQSHKDKPSSAP